MTGDVSASVVVVGSVNTDLNVELERFPTPGETVDARSLSFGDGGKGANSAVTVAQLGASVALVACIGRRGAQRILSTLTSSGVDVSGVSVVDDLTGHAIVMRDVGRENMIVRASGANGQLSPTAVRAAIEARRHSVRVVLADLEVPEPTVLEAARAARDIGALFVLDPAPAVPLSDELVDLCFAMLPNESELSRLGIEARMRGLPNVIETRGERGTRRHSFGSTFETPAYPITAVDSVGAGDAFAGGFATRLSEIDDIDEIIRFASAAGALAASNRGARVGFERARVEQLMAGHTNSRMGEL